MLYKQLLSFNSSFYHIRTFARYTTFDFFVLFSWLSSTNVFIICSVRRPMNFLSSYLAHSCDLTSDVNKRIRMNEWAENIKESVVFEPVSHFTAKHFHATANFKLTCNGYVHATYSRNQQLASSPVNQCYNLRSTGCNFIRNNVLILWHCSQDRNWKSTNSKLSLEY